MALSEGEFELGAFAAGLALNLSHQQMRLNREYAQQLREFLPVLRLARDLGYEQLARTVAPSPIVARKSEVGVRVRVSATAEREFALNVRPINAGFYLKYRHSEFVMSSITLTVESIPVAPGQGRKPDPA